MDKLIVSSLEAKALEPGEVRRLTGLYFISLTIPDGYIPFCTVAVDGVRVEVVRQE